MPASVNPVSAAVRRRRTLLAASLLAATAVVVAVIVFSPSPPDMDGQRRLAQWLARAHEEWLPRWITFDVVEFASNIVMFLPLGLFGAVVFPRAKRLVLAACALFSTAVELFQWIALPARQGDWHDVLANTLGAALGIGLAILVGWAARDAGAAAESAGVGDPSAGGSFAGGRSAGGSLAGGSLAGGPSAGVPPTDERDAALKS